LVHAKLNYGCQFYSSAKPTILKRLDPIQNQCLRACTGAFRSCLSYAWDFISLKHLYKIQVHPESPTYTAILEKPHEANPVRERILSLYDGYSILSPNICKIFTQETLPWRLLVFQVCPFIMMKSSTSSDKMHSAFLKQNEEHKCPYIYRWIKNVQFGGLCSSSTLSFT